MRGIVITKIEIENFKSIEKAVINLSNLNILIGPNGAGKSNLIDCFRFLKEILIYSEFKRRFDEIVFNSEIKRKVKIHLYGKYNDKPWEYLIQIKGDERRECILAKEELKYDNENYIIYPAENNTAEIKTQSGKPKMSYQGTLFLYFAKHEYWEFSWILHQFIKNWLIFFLYPESLKKISEIKKIDHFKEKGDLFSSYIHHLFTRYPEHFKELLDYMKEVFTEIENIKIEIIEGKPALCYLLFKEKEIENEIPQWNYSDGILAFFAFASLLYSPFEHPLILIEEPENYIHHSKWTHLADIFMNLAEKSQLIITTHSPYFLNHFSPENVFVVKKYKGRTKFIKASDIKGIRKALKEFRLGEIWYSKELEVEDEKEGNSHDCGR